MVFSPGDRNTRANEQDRPRLVADIWRIIDLTHGYIEIANIVSRGPDVGRTDQCSNKSRLQPF
jgi:hypothetical protein